MSEDLHSISFEKADSPYPRSPVCPKCKSAKVRVIRQTPVAAYTVKTEHGLMFLAAFLTELIASTLRIAWLQVLAATAFAIILVGLIVAAILWARNRPVTFMRICSNCRTTAIVDEELVTGSVPTTPDSL